MYIFIFIRDQVKKKGIELENIKSGYQIIDIFPRSLNSEVFCKLKNSLGVIDERELSLRGDVDKINLI